MFSCWLRRHWFRNLLLRYVIADSLHVFQYILNDAGVVGVGGRWIRRTVLIHSIVRYTEIIASSMFYRWVLRLF